MRDSPSRLETTSTVSQSQSQSETPRRREPPCPFPSDLRRPGGQPEHVLPAQSHRPRLPLPRRQHALRVGLPGEPLEEPSPCRAGLELGVDLLLKAVLLAQRVAVDRHTHVRASKSPERKLLPTLFSGHGARWGSDILASVAGHVVLQSTLAGSAPLGTC